jgi:hypothetical protein
MKRNSVSSEAPQVPRESAAPAAGIRRQVGSEIAVTGCSRFSSLAATSGEGDVPAVGASVENVDVVEALQAGRHKAVTTEIHLVRIRTTTIACPPCRRRVSSSRVRQTLCPADSNLPCGFFGVPKAPARAAGAASGPPPWPSPAAGGTKPRQCLSEEREPVRARVRAPLLTLAPAPPQWLS